VPCTPNGDDRNDRFVPLGSIGVQGTLEVYNRWGQLVFATDAIAHGWDGHGDGGPVPDGTYYYVITPADPRNERTTGHVTLLR
jgi:gliding motility-associated-like protein